MAPSACPSFEPFSQSKAHDSLLHGSQVPCPDAITANTREAISSFQTIGFPMTKSKTVPVFNS